MAAEDFTAPPVLKVQSRLSLSVRPPSATPSSAGPPRNIGQSAACADAPALTAAQLKILTRSNASVQTGQPGLGTARPQRIFSAAGPRGRTVPTPPALTVALPHVLFCQQSVTRL